MKKIAFLLVALLLAWASGAQEIRLLRGDINETLPLNDSVGRNLSVYIPSDFDPARTWPILFLCEAGGDPSRAMRLFKGPAEASGYVLATSRVFADTLTLAQQVLYISKSLEMLGTILPLDRNRIHAGGYGPGGQLAGLLPYMLKSVGGVLSVAAGPPNSELVTNRAPYHYVAVLGRADHNYLNMQAAEEFLARKNIPNHVLYYDEPVPVPPDVLLQNAMETLTLMDMAAGRTAVDSSRVRRVFDDWLEQSRRLVRQGQYLLAYDRLEEGISLFEGLWDVSPMEEELKEVRRDKAYRIRKREAASLELKEGITRQDYEYYLDEDVLSFNLENLGWWKHQMGVIDGHKKSSRPEEQLMGLRLEGFLRALSADYLRMATSDGEPDDDARIFLYMLRTLIDPAEPENYLRVISLTSKYGDFGTALFYLEELLKTGYSDKDKLYSLEHTALLRISPEFNALIEKYLKEARYDPPEPPERFY